MPFAEVGGEVAAFLEGFRDGGLVRAEVAAMLGDIGADGGATGEDGGAGGRADGGGGVEVIEDDGVFRHVIEVRSFDKGMAGVAHVSVALIICHDEDDVGAFVFFGQD